MAEEQKLDLAVIKKSVTSLVNDAEVKTSLLATAFKGLDELNMKKAVFEGMMRGFTVKDFLTKNIYAIKFGNGYNLVNSIDYVRKIGMRSGIVGKEAPVFEMDNKTIVSCSVTVKRRVGGYVGDFTATVFFDEYTTGNGNWKSKPRTMIAKVAEMHAIRMACPEEASQMYAEEEMESEAARAVTTVIGDRLPEAKENGKTLTMGALADASKDNSRKMKANDADIGHGEGVEEVPTIEVEGEEIGASITI